MGKREEQRKELFRVIWKIANEQRGAVDGWDFKQYILGTLFYRFISENLTNYINKLDSGVSFDNMKDEEVEEGKNDIINEKGFFIYPSHLFSNVIKKLNIPEFKQHLNENLNKILKSIENSSMGFPGEENFKGLFSDYDVNSDKLGVTIEDRNKRLTNLLLAINDLKLGNLCDNTIDLFGDAYEYLMAMYASSAGKSGGEFFTPQEISELLAQLVIGDKTSVSKVYDPACGSGGLLLKFAKILGKNNVHKGFFGQELNPTTFNLCRINMFLHDINYEKFNIACGNTLLKPKHKNDEPFEAIVSNPPYSVSWEGDTNPLLINDDRFSPAGVLAPKSKADLAFVMHCLAWLDTNGTAAIVNFPGALYRGGTEQKIRKYLVDNNFIDAIIQLPSNLFFGTTITTCIMVLKKSKKTNDILFIDASREFESHINSNKLSGTNIANILKYFKNRVDISNISKLVVNTNVVAKNYNLSINTYVVQENIREPIDIDVLNQQIKTTVSKIDTLRKEIEKITAELK